MTPTVAGVGAINGWVRPRDNFDGLRLAAALAVLVGHAFILTGVRPVPALFGLPLHTLGVAVFFAVSGYLVGGSWQRDPSVARFLWHRVLRILPGLAALVVLTVVVVGPLLSNLAVGDYFARAQTWGYLGNAVLVTSFDLPGVFADHERTAVNGSLWTLGIEFCRYLAVIALGLVRGRIRPWAWLGAGVLLAVMSLHGSAALEPATTMAVFFAGGVLCRLVIPSRVLVWRAAFPLALAWFVAVAIAPESTTVLAWLLLPFCAITLGRGSTPVVRDVGRMGDLSYGLYLWSYLVQQVVIVAFGVLWMPVNLVLVTLASLAAASLSWWVVERRGLALKGLLAPAVPAAPPVAEREFSAAGPR